jgi:predicted negative regulator of RcsB-dependent stress response
MYDLEEQEQIDALKGWWGEYGRLVILMVVAAALAAVATVGWRWYKGKQAEDAAQLYTTLEKAVGGKDSKQARETAAQLMERYGATVYGPMAALTVAKLNYEAGDTTGATTQLRWTVDNAKDPDVVATARLRLAGVLLDEKKHDEALKVLEPEHPDAFNALFEDRRGDIYTAQGKIEEARGAYRRALEKLPAQGNYRLIVQVKLDGLGGGK